MNKSATKAEAPEPALLLSKQCEDRIRKGDCDDCGKGSIRPNVATLCRKSCKQRSLKSTEARLGLNMLL